MNTRLKIWWDGDQKYFVGTVVDYDGSFHTVKYDDGELKKHDLLTPGVEQFIVAEQFAVETQHRGLRHAHTLVG